MITTNSKQIEKIEFQGKTKTDYPSYDNFKESMLFNTKHITVKEKVKSILRKDKYARKNYFYLCLLYWVQNGDITMKIDFKDFSKITKPETISRCCRELVSEAKKGNQELKWLLNNEEVLNEREYLREMNHAYYQDLNNSNYSKNVK